MHGSSPAGCAKKEYVMTNEQRQQKLFELQHKVHNTLSPEMVEYLQAELGYSSEIANGYSQRAQVSAELRLISAAEKLLNKLRVGG